jgi:hypothetical protein
MSCGFNADSKPTGMRESFDCSIAVMSLRKTARSTPPAKPLSWGTWPKEMKKTREWWYRSVEEPAEVELAMRFALSQPSVVTGIPPSFVDLLDRTIEAAKAFKPLDEPAVEKLKEMAANQSLIFLREEQQVTFNHPHWCPYPDRPHECV